MLKKVLIVALLSAGAGGICGAQQAAPTATAQAAAESENALLKSIASWLSADLELPPINSNPRIERASSAQMAGVRYEGVQQLRQVLGVYEDATKTIYLPEAWAGSSPAEQSILVHQMVHHFQNAAGFNFACPQEREKLAYAAQERWLASFGQSLSSAFEIDATTLLLSTECIP